MIFRIGKFGLFQFFLITVAIFNVVQNQNLETTFTISSNDSTNQEKEVGNINNNNLIIIMPNNSMTRQYNYSITKIVQKCQNSNRTRLRCLCQLSLCRLSLVSEIRTIPPTNCQNKQGMTEDHCNALGCILEPRDVQR